MAMEAILFVVFLALLVINVPIGVALGLSGITALLFGDMPTPPRDTGVMSLALRPSWAVVLP